MINIFAIICFLSISCHDKEGEWDMAKRLLIWVIHFYQKYLSVLKGGPSCRYIPTCSAYAIQALEKYGFFKGSYLAIKRILRCHPFHKGGFYDPLP